VALLSSVAVESCSRPRKTAETSAQNTFSSPEEAGAALLAAVKSGDSTSFVAIFGPGSRAVLFTGDAGIDNGRLNDFVTAYNQMHRWVPIKAGGQVLQVGADNHPFPIPLGQDSSGRWYFDTAAGKDEILARRIGKNELTAMDATEAIAKAEHQYHQETHDGDNVKQYAQKFTSDPGKHDGLYWPAAEGRTPSPLSRLADFGLPQSSADGADSRSFNGYRYRILTKAETPNGPKDYIVDGKMIGGFAILAYPAEYRNSGIMSFLVGEDGTVYQKDLGESTMNLAGSMTTYNPADGWIIAMTPAGSASRMKP
jgi:hypothetical protein